MNCTNRDDRNIKVTGIEVYPIGQEGAACVFFKYVAIGLWIRKYLTHLGNRSARVTPGPSKSPRAPQKKNKSSASPSMRVACAAPITIKSDSERSPPSNSWSK